jgi:diguanylate cyclase (GGDEF)-like protein
MAASNRNNFASPPLRAAPPLQDIAPSIDARNEELARELRRIERRDWWIWGNTIFVILILTFAVISFALPALLAGAETYFKIRFAEAIFALTAFVVLFNFYTIYQQVIIKRLRRQLAEKQGHTDILRNLALLDPLTGLYNRRFAEQRLAAEVARSERKGHPLTVMTLDLNNFKQINDTYGHAAGDEVLRKFALLLNRVIRGTDLAVRLGGDEFLVLLPECSLDQVQVVLGRLGSIAVEWQGNQIPVTFSAGWRQYEMGDRPDELLERADEVLYVRKRASKEAARTAGQPQEPTAPLHVLVDLTCPHCHKGNLVAVDPQSGGTDAAGPKPLHCAHCNQPWEASLSGPITSGPFPK